ncbi:hypothetical protein HELRODRAFT_175071 [Helobdella robusta]|uniref:Uncharacterized protein n=1 Tax=Helobdella robusta TaxID=6412 RepID=T1F8T3_HELRO|nr:hypothetical protein HELRODRAFT_175071 [Helobdella robusta]ESO01044.1 hypothetical protein HELRODRAFT_175071 [Helobdella robusta]
MKENAKVETSKVVELGTRHETTNKMVTNWICVMIQHSNEIDNNNNEMIVLYVITMQWELTESCYQRLMDSCYDEHVATARIRTHVNRLNMFSKFCGGSNPRKSNNFTSQIVAHVVRLPYFLIIS